MELHERIDQLVRHLPYSQKDLAEIIGVSLSRISNIKKGANKPNSDLIINILNKFREVNPYWLLLGEGEMFLKSSGDEIDYDKVRAHFTLDKNDTVKSADHYVLRIDLDRERLLHDKLISSYEENINLLKEKADVPDKRSDKAMIDYMGGTVAEDATEPPKRKAANW